MSTPYHTIPGTNVRYVEMSDMRKSDACAKYIASEKRFDRSPSVPDEVPEQWLRNKIARNYAWGVTSSGVDTKNKLFWFNVGMNAEIVHRKELTYDEVAKCMHWKSFKLIDNGLKVKFVNDESWYEPLPAKPRAKRGKKKAVK